MLIFRFKKRIGYHVVKYFWVKIIKFILYKKKKKLKSEEILFMYLLISAWPWDDIVVLSVTKTSVIYRIN